jgi:hypothetical protein
VENKDESDSTFVHYHKAAGMMKLYELLVDAREGPIFAEIIQHEDECDQSRRRGK